MNLSTLVEIPALIAPQQVILVDGEYSCTYAELYDAARRVAALLATRGLGLGSRVATFATNSVGAVQVLLGAACSGATAVPMNYRARGAEITHLLGDSGAGIVFADDAYVDLLRSNGAAADQVVAMSELPALCERLDPLGEAVEVEDDAIAILLYTSGTASLPKGVKLTHGGFSSHVLASVDAADGEFHGRTLLTAPLYHVAGLSSLAQAVFAGREIVLMPQFEAGGWLSRVAAHRTTHAFLVPSMLALLLRHEDFDRTDLSSLELVTYGAAPMPSALLHEALRRFPPTVAFSGAYGQTETNSTVAVLGPEDHRLEGSAEQIALRTKRLASVGKLLPDVEAQIQDNAGCVAPPGVVGEVQLRTARAMAGYWGERADDTRVTVEGDGWIHTGDLGYLDEDGYLFLTGRVTDLIIRGGENISPPEIEAVLTRYQGVEEAIAFGVADEQWGQRIYAAVIPCAGATLTGRELVEVCRLELAGHKRPEDVFVVEDFPRTATGKVVRRSMAAVLMPRGRDDHATG